MLTGIVAVTLNAAGDLRITGDSASNNVQISNPGLITVSGFGGTLIRFNGVLAAGVALPTTVLRDLTVNLLAGNDSIFVSGVTATRNTNISTAVGSDVVNVQSNTFGVNVTINAGTSPLGDAVTFASNNVGKDLSIALGAQGPVGGQVQVQNVVVNGAMRVTGASGNKTFAISNVLVAKTNTINLGSGNNVLAIAGVTIGGATSINAGAGIDQVSIAGLSQVGGIALNLGGGTDLVAFVGAPSLFSSAVTFNGGVGFDTVTGLSNLGVLQPGNVKLLGWEQQFI